LIRPKGSKRKMMKKKLKWKKGMQANRLTEIISRIESTRKAQAHLEALELKYPGITFIVSQKEEED
jgi:hypothetical protein